MVTIRLVYPKAELFKLAPTHLRCASGIYSKNLSFTLNLSGCIQSVPRTLVEYIMVHLSGSHRSSCIKCQMAIEDSKHSIHNLSQQSFIPKWLWHPPYPSLQHPEISRPTPSHNAAKSIAFNHYGRELIMIPVSPSQTAHYCRHRPDES
jgi:hypothetical protein